MRVRSLGVALVLTAGLVAPVIGAQEARADGPTATISISCTAVTYAYTGFPNTINTIDTEQVTNETPGPDFGTVLATRSAPAFTFTGSSGTDTISIAGVVSDGDTINGYAAWTNPAPGDQATIQTLGGCGGSCPQGSKANFRWHYSANGTSGSWSGTKTAPCPSTLTMGPQAMEGDLKVAPGTLLEAGYDFTVPGNNHTLTITVANPEVVFAARCVSGATPSLPVFTVTMPTRTYTVTDSQWYPSGDQHSPLVYEGSAAVPDLCSGGLVRLDHGGTFTASVS